MTIELFRDQHGIVTIRVGKEVACMTIGDWSKLVAFPQKPTLIDIARMGGPDTAPSEYTPDDCA